MAQTRAIDIIEKEVRPSVRKVEKFNREAIQSSEKLIKETRERLDASFKEIQFYLLVQRASNDDRKAFDELLAVCNSAGHPFQNTAQQAVLTIVRSARLEPTINLDAQVQNLSYAEFLRSYRNSHRSSRVPLLVSLWRSKKLSMKEKLDFLTTVIKDDDSLHAVEKACELMNEVAKLNKNIAGAHFYLSWWDKNKERY